MKNNRLKQIALELIHQPNLAEAFKRRLADIFFPANVALIKYPLSEFELIDDTMETCVVLTCWKLESVLDKIHEDLPPTPEFHWKFNGFVLHPDRDDYRYIYFKMEEGDYERETSGKVTGM